MSKRAMHISAYLAHVALVSDLTVPVTKLEILIVRREKKRDRNVLVKTKHEMMVRTEIRPSRTSVEPQKEKLPLELRGRESEDQKGDETVVRKRRNLSPT